MQRFEIMWINLKINFNYCKYNLESFSQFVMRKNSDKFQFHYLEIVKLFLKVIQLMFNVLNFEESENSALMLDYQKFTYCCN